MKKIERVRLDDPNVEPTKAQLDSIMSAVARDAREQKKRVNAALHAQLRAALKNVAANAQPVR